MEKNKWVGLSALLFFIAIFAYQQANLSNVIEKNLLSYLITTDDLPPEKAFDKVYILGGSQESLKAKYKTAASIYVRGRCKEIFILSRPGTTYFSRSLGRNLTNDEWSLMTLEHFSVPKKNVRTLEVESGFFGTYSEAKCVSRLAGQRGWNSLLIITSPHHTKRVKKSFEYFMNKTMIEVLVIASKDQAGLFELISELFKLKIYELFLLT